MLHLYCMSEDEPGCWTRNATANEEVEAHELPQLHHNHFEARHLKVGGRAWEELRPLPEEVGAHEQLPQLHYDHMEGRLHHCEVWNHKPWRKEFGLLSEVVPRKNFAAMTNLPTRKLSEEAPRKNSAA